MAPARQAASQPFAKDEKVLCFHHEMLYEAKILDIQPAEEGEGFQYKIHYKGWKNTWDDWVPVDRIRKFTDENRDLAAQLHAQMKSLQQKNTKQPKKTVKANGAESARGSEERSAGVAAQGGRGPRRARDYDLEQEDHFHAKPSLKLPIPDVLKAMMVDDWENITRNNQLVPIPHPHPVDEILKDYLDAMRPQRGAGTAGYDILEETVAGLKEYFEKTLARILLYRFERPQWQDIKFKLWESPDWTGEKTVCSTYGAEHLLRLLVSLEDLAVQTNLDQQSCNKLREELTQFSNWLARNSTKYFVSEYTTPNQDYIDRTRF